MDKTLRHSKKDIIIISVLCLAYLIAGAVALDYDFYLYAFIPVAVLGVMLIVMKFYYSVFLVALLTPFSIFFKMEMFSVTVPTEPILILVMFVFLWDCTLSRNYDTKALHNPISLMIFVNLAWMIVAALFSWDVVVSIKYIISRLWFVIPCYFMMVPIFKRPQTIRWFVALYGFSLSIIIIICSIKFAMLGFAFAEMNQIPAPFYNDHTAYGAAIGLFLPATLLYTFGNKELCPNKKYRVLFIFISLCLTVGFILSYARATWLSVIVAAGVFVLVYFKINLNCRFGIAVLDGYNSEIGTQFAGFVGQYYGTYFFNEQHIHRRFKYGAYKPMGLCVENVQGASDYGLGSGNIPIHLRFLPTLFPADDNFNQRRHIGQRPQRIHRSVERTGIAGMYNSDGSFRRYNIYRSENIPHGKG